MTDDEAALLDDVRFALRGLDPWPPKGGTRPSEEYVAHFQLCDCQIITERELAHRVLNRE